MIQAQRNELATLAGGCFWGVEELIRQMPGVLDTEVGYTGGTVGAPTYEKVKKGTTGHAEAIQISFDPSRLSYEALLQFFFRLLAFLTQLISDNPEETNNQTNRISNIPQQADSLQKAGA